jgi:hypothetical protein
VTALRRECSMSIPKSVHLFVATPCYGGQVHQRYMQCVCLLMQYGAANGIRVAVELLGRESLITRGRNMLVSKFMDSQATHLFFIDADTGFEIRQVLRMLEFDQDVVAGMYPLKLIDWNDEALARAQGGEPLDYAAIRFVGTPLEPMVRSGDFVEGSYAGTGFMLIKRNVIARMFEAYPELKYSRAHNSNEGYASPNQYALFDAAIDPETREYLSEDYAFCQRWRKLGGKVWLDTDSRLVHIGNHEFYANPKSRLAPVEEVAPTALRAFA